MRRPRRFRVSSDLNIQLRLCVRVALYWCCCCLAVGLLLVGKLAIRDYPLSAGELWQRSVELYAAPLAASLFFLPLILVDLLMHTNRVTGPLKRIRDGLRQAAAGRPVAPIQLRGSDLLQDMARDFNLCLSEPRVSARESRTGAVGSENAILSNTPGASC